MAPSCSNRPSAPTTSSELAKEGVRLAKFGFGRYPTRRTASPRSRRPKQVGIVVMCHSGGASIPGSKPITAEHLMLLSPDVCGHINGGPTALDPAGVDRIVRETDMVLQLVQAGNLRSTLEITATCSRSGEEQRVILGSDTPTGTGVMPLGVLKTVAEIASLGGVPPERVWCWATGNTAAVYDLDGGTVARESRRTSSSWTPRGAAGPTTPSEPWPWETSPGSRA